MFHAVRQVTVYIIPTAALQLETIIYIYGDKQPQTTQRHVPENEYKFLQ